MAVRTLEFGQQKPVFFSDTSALDAFGRLRVSELTTLINIVQHSIRWNILIDEEVIGTGTITWDQPNSRRVLTTAANSDAAICQTFTRAQYSAGKSQLIKMTFSSFSPEDNITK